MNKTLRNILIMLAIIMVAAGLFYGGMLFSRMSAWYGAYGPGGMMMGGGYGLYQNGQQGYYGPGGMMGSGGYGGMMDGGMMGGAGYGHMMGGYGSLYGVEPLSAEEARQAVESYLSSFGNGDLAIEEIMIFDNNAYAIIVEQSTGVGAFELLVDPVTQAVYPEYGPNMMWNLKYGMMGPGMMMGRGNGPGGMMGGSGFSNDTQVPDVSADMPVSAEEASQVAQLLLDTYYPGVEVSDEITAFYGYYTLDIERDGKIIGMLSVNGFTRQVFPHTWHGTFIEMSEE
jgi:hypothetical protein